MLSSPIILFYSFLVIVVFAMGVAPTALWKRFGASASGAAARARHDRMAGHFAKATAATAFTADVDYVPVGIGFAYDRTRALVFVAGERSGTPAEAVIPLADFRAFATGVITGGFSDENYVDLFPADASQPKWRISCGGDATTPYAIDRLLSGLGLARA
jgi:hypothetical protein